MIVLRDLGRAVAHFLAIHRTALAALTILATAFLWDVLLTDKSLGAFDVILSQSSWQDEFVTPRVHQPILVDSPTAHYPQRKYDWDSLKQGQNANYNPYIFNGMPWSAQGVGAFLTSTPQLFMDVANALDWATWLRLILAGFFMYLLLLELGVGRGAAMFAGVVWMLNLHQIVWLQFPQHLATQLWIPLLFLVNLLALKSRLRFEHTVAIVVVNVLFFTSGYTQIVLFTYIALGVFNTAYLILSPERRQWPQKFRTWVVVHLLHISAVVFYGVGIWAEVEFIAEGLRGSQQWRGQVSDFEFGPSAIVDFLASLIPPLTEFKYLYTPDYFGGVWGGHYRVPYGNLVEDGRYFGVLSLVFALYGLLTLYRARDWWLRASCLLTVMMLCGWFYRDPLAIEILRLIPFADKGNFSRFITLIVFFGAILAALGLEAFLRDAPSRRWRILALALAVFVAIPLVAWVAGHELGVAKLIYPLLVVTASALILWFVGDRPRVAGVAVVLIVTADLFYAGYGFNTRMHNERLFPTNNAIRYLLNDTDSYRVAVLAQHPLYHPNILSYYDLPTIGGYSTVLPVSYAGFSKALFPDRHITLNGILFFKEPNVAAMRMMNVKYVLSDRQFSQTGLEFVLTTNNHHIYRLVNPLPRAYCPSTVIDADGFERQLQALPRALENDSRAVVTSGVQVDDAVNCTVSDVRVFTNSIEFDVESSADYLVFAPYSFSKHWRAEVNGVAGQTHRANAIFTAVSVPAGRSTVRLYYQNHRESLGAGILVVGSLALLFWLVCRRRADLIAVVLGLVAMVTGAKAAFSLPGVRNDRVPERAPLSAPLTVEQPGLIRADRHTPSPRLVAGQALTYALDIPSRDLTRIDLLAATYLEYDLDFDLQVELRDGNGQLLAQVRVPGWQIHDNRWFKVDIPTLESDASLQLAVSAEHVDGNFSLWLDAESRLCLRAHYEWRPGSGAIQ